MHPTTYTPAEFEDLIHTKESAAFAYFFDNYAAAINGIVIRLYPQRFNAEQAFKNTLVHIWSRMKEYNHNTGPVFSWIIIVMRAYTRDVLKNVELDARSKEGNINDLSYGYTRRQIEEHVPLKKNTVSTALTGHARNTVPQA